MSENSPQNPTTERSVPLGYEFKKAIPTVILACLAAIITSWWNTQITQTDLRYRVEAVERQVKTNTDNITASSGQIQNQAIKFAEVGVTQNNMLTELRDIKAEQEEIKRSLRR